MIVEKLNLKITIVKTNPYFVNDADGTSTYKKAKLCIKITSRWNV